MANLNMTDTPAIPTTHGTEVERPLASGCTRSTPSRRKPDAVAGLHISGKKRSYYHQSR